MTLLEDEVRDQAKGTLWFDVKEFNEKLLKKILYSSEIENGKVVLTSNNENNNEEDWH